MREESILCSYLAVNIVYIHVLNLSKLAYLRFRTLDYKLIN